MLNCREKPALPRLFSNMFSYMPAWMSRPARRAWQSPAPSSQEAFAYRYHQRPPDFLDFFCLDFNEYQGEIAPSTARAVQSAGLMRHYPLLPDKDPLTEEAARFLNIPPSQAALANGADDALFHLFFLAKKKFPQKAGSFFFSPTYDHALHFMNVTGFPPAPFGEAPPAGGRIVYLSFPNNPTGEEISPDGLEAALAAEKNSFWILDLTYLFYSRHRIQDFAKKILSHENAAAVLSFAKSFPLAGLRMACVFSANPSVLRYFQRDYNKKTVNALARAAALSCFQNMPFYEAERRRIFDNRGVLASLFQQAAERGGFGLKARPLDGRGGNFFLMEGGRAELSRFAGWLYSRKIIIRLKDKWGFARISSVSDSFLEGIKRQLKL